MTAETTAHTSTESQGLLRTLGVWDVVAMNVVAVVTLRWITRAARIGPAALVLWAAAWLVFFLPLAGALTELSSRYPQEGGIYAWTRRAFGPLHGFVCGWCLWLNNLFYFPSMLLFAAANVAISVAGDNAALADNRTYSVVFVLAALWVSAILSILGFRTGRWVNTLAVISVWVPAALLLVAGVIAITTFGSASSFHLHDFVPRDDVLPTLSLWAGICFAFSGFEVATLVGEEVRDSRRTIPRGIILAGSIATIIYIAGTASVLVTIPADSLLERTGIAEAVNLACEKVHLVHLGPLAGVLLALGAIGCSNAWFASAGRVPFAVGRDGTCPAVLTRLHPRFRTPYFALAVQGVAASLLFVSSVFLSFAGTRTTIQEAYDILVNLTILLYFIPYLYLFLALFRLRTGGRIRVALTAGTGMMATAVCLLLVFIPPAGTGSAINYEMNVVGQSATIIGVGLLVYALTRRRHAAT